MPLKSNPATDLFVPDKQGGAVSQRAIERWGQYRPPPCSSWLYNSVGQTVTSTGHVTLTFDTCINDGNGIGNFALNGAYPYGSVLNLGAGCWALYMYLVTSVGSTDAWTLTTIAVNTESRVALPFPYADSWSANANTAASGGLPTFAIPNLVVGGWGPRANGASVTGQYNLLLGYAGAAGTNHFAANLIVTRVS